jgi:hypothetical protein
LAQEDLAKCFKEGDFAGAAAATKDLTIAWLHLIRLGRPIQHIEPPQAREIDPKKARSIHDGLTQWAQDHGVFTLEAKMREALNAGRTSEASRLRYEAMALMRRGAAKVNHMVNRGATQCSSSR